MTEPFLRKSYVRFQLPALAWIVLIFIASSIPGNAFPDIGIFQFDKLVHIALFFTLSLLTYRATRYQSRFPALSVYALWVSLLFAVLYGATDELHQIFVPGRTPDPYDWLADSFGALSYYVIHYVRSRRRPIAR